MNPDNAPHMVQQIIKFSDGSETVINYRGVIVDGVLTPDTPEVDSEEADGEAPNLVTRIKRAYTKRKQN